MILSHDFQFRYHSQSAGAPPSPRPETLLTNISGFVQRSSALIPASHGWHYLSGDKVWLYDSQILVSFLMSRNSSNGSPCPRQTDVDFPGNNLETVWTVDLLSCVQLCGSTRSCLGLTFLKNICRLKYKMENRITVKTNIKIESVAFNCSLGIHFDAFVASKL